MVDKEQLAAECARVSVYFEDLDSWFTGDVQRAGHEKGHAFLRFMTDGYEDEYNLDAMLTDPPTAKIIAYDSQATAAKKQIDMLWKIKAKVTVYLAATEYGNLAGRYSGRIAGLRVEEKGVFHLIEYDAGDRHWLDLSKPKWSCRVVDPRNDEEKEIELEHFRRKELKLLSRQQSANAMLDRLEDPLTPTRAASSGRGACAGASSGGGQRGGGGRL